MWVGVRDHSKKKKAVVENVGGSGTLITVLCRVCHGESFLGGGGDRNFLKVSNKSTFGLLCDRW